MYQQSEKNLLNSNISSTCSHTMVNFGPLAAEISWEFGAPQRISTGFVSWFCYCSDVIHQRPTKLCTMFGSLLGWYTVYTLYILAFAPWRNFATCKIHFASKSYVLLYWQRYCMALEQWASAKLYKEWNYGTFAEGATYIRLGGHYVGHWPTF